MAVVTRKRIAIPKRPAPRPWYLPTLDEAAFVDALLDGENTGAEVRRRTNWGPEKVDAVGKALAAKGLVMDMGWDVDEDGANTRVWGLVTILQGDLIELDH